MTIYTTREWKGYGKNYYGNECRRDGNTVTKYKCHRSKTCDGKENNWNEGERTVDSWDIEKDDMPEWLKSYL